MCAPHCRYLQLQQDPLVRLVLQAFQMSLSSCMVFSTLRMMRQQVVLRIAGVSGSSGSGKCVIAREWYHTQLAACRAGSGALWGQQVRGGGEAVCGLVSCLNGAARVLVRRRRRLGPGFCLCGLLLLCMFAVLSIL